MTPEWGLMRAKYLQLLLVVASAVTYLLLPPLLDTQNLCGLALAVVVILTRAQWIYYKKYL